MIVEEFELLKANGSGLVPEFDISRQWLTEIEPTRSGAYCIVVTDETRDPETHQHDRYLLNGVVIIYAQDQTDNRAKLDLMIEDAIAVLRRVFRALGGLIQGAHLDTITVSEGSTAEQTPQAVLRWSCMHQRAGMV